nr:MAG TPA: hypothetical protein [Bacteriophage sp.]
MITLSFTEEDRTLLLNLSSIQRDRVFFALLAGEEAAEDWGEVERDSLASIRKKIAARKKTADRVKKYRERYCNRYSNSYSNAPPPSPPRRSPGIRVLRMSDIPFSVSAPVVLSCSALCSALLNAIRFHGQYAYSGYSSTG